jgi:peptide/nickel transport system substrate-binding protein
VLHGRPFARDALPAIREDLARVGIRAEPRLLTDAEHFELLKSGLTLWMTRIGCATGDAGELFEDLVHSQDAQGRFGSLNNSGYANPSLDAAIERSVALEATRSRLAAFKEIMAALLRDQVLVPLYNDRDVYVLNQGLSWSPRSDSEIRAADLVVAR